MSFPPHEFVQIGHQLCRMTSSHSFQFTFHSVPIASLESYILCVHICGGVYKMQRVVHYFMCHRSNWTNSIIYIWSLFLGTLILLASVHIVSVALILEPTMCQPLHPLRDLLQFRHRSTRGSLEFPRSCWFDLRTIASSSSTHPPNHVITINLGEAIPLLIGGGQRSSSGRGAWRRG